jgi:hypothetical protein
LAIDAVIAHSRKMCPGRLAYIISVVDKGYWHWCLKVEAEKIVRKFVLLKKI